MAAQNRRASILAGQGKLDEARKLIRAMPERTPADARMKLMAEVQLLRDNKQYKAAYDLLAQAVAKDPRDTDLLYDQAMLAEKLDDFAEMERLLRQVMALKPDYHHAYNALGYSLAERNVRLPEAKQLIQKALEFAPGDPFISDSLGWVEFRMGNRPRRCASCRPPTRTPRRRDRRPPGRGALEPWASATRPSRSGGRPAAQRRERDAAGDPQAPAVKP
jgi:tetratricopeptide (TPR) repeat protein